MGKNKKGLSSSGGTTGYAHAHNPNPAARESDDRRLDQLSRLGIKRLEVAVSRQMESMRRYICPSNDTTDSTRGRDKKKPRIGRRPLIMLDYYLNDFLIFF